MSGERNKELTRKLKTPIVNIRDSQIWLHTGIACGAIKNTAAWFSPQEILISLVWSAIVVLRV